MSEDMTQAERMIELALEGGAILCCDQYGNPYIHYVEKASDVYVTQSLKSGAVKDWLAGKLWAAIRKAPGGEALGSALAVLRAMARKGPTYPLYTRIAPDGAGGALIDLANERWNCIRVTPKGWSIDEPSMPTFRRYSHMKPLPIPSRDGDPFKILEFANLRDEGEKLLYVVSTTSYFIPEIQHPILLFWGPHGSGKSLSMMAPRAVCDPSITPLLSLPRNDRELVQQLFHHSCGFYDNVSSLPDWTSDIFCRAVTGAGNSKRALYTDDDDVVYDYRRFIGINGINIPARRGDFFDRTLILRCDMIDNSHRLEERIMTKQLEDAVPTILGGMLDTVVKALNIYPTIKIDKLYRMADFTRWGVAITEALNIDREKFINALEENVRSQTEETLKASLVGTVLVRFISTMKDDHWEGEPTTLYHILEGEAQSMTISTRQHDWPKDVRWLLRRINEILPSLSALGYTVEVERTGARRLIRLSRTGITLKSDVNVDMTSQKDDINDDIDNTSQSFTGAPQICADCGQPIIDGSALWWMGKDRVCRKCWKTRKLKAEHLAYTEVPGPEPAGEEADGE
jgi:hypothetical protein